MNKVIKYIQKYLRANGSDQYLTKKYFDYGLVFFSLLLGFYLRWDIYNIIIFSFIVWILLNPVSSKLLAKATLYFMVFTPLLLIIKRENRAEQFAIFTYYFLVLTVVTLIIEHKKGEANKK